MAAAVAAARTRRVPLTTLIAAATAIDHSGAAAVTWRSRLAAAIGELNDSGLVELPATKWDTTASPRLPVYVTRFAVPTAPAAGRDEIVWHAELGWAAQLDANGQLSTSDRQLLAQVNVWLRRRGETVVPQRERSLDIFSDEKVLDGVVFTPLFGPGRLTYQLLRCEPCWPPVHQEILGTGPWLLVENWTTFRTLAMAARACGWEGRLIWGAGNQVGTRLIVATREAVPQHGLWYFGDIDAPGFAIARLATTRAQELGLGPVRPATALYGLCYEAGSVCPGKRAATTTLIQWIVDWIGEPLGRQLAEVAANSGKIVQEVVGVELLATQAITRILPSLRGRGTVPESEKALARQADPGNLAGSTS